MNKLELLTAWYKDPKIQEFERYNYQIQNIRERQENDYDQRFQNLHYAYMSSDKLQKCKEEDQETLRLFQSAFSWKERYRYSVKFEVVCDDYYFRDGEWSNDLESIKQVIRHAEEPPEDFYDFEWDWNGDEGENINSFRLGDERKRYLDIGVTDLTPKFEIVEDSDSIKLVEIGGKTNV